MSIELQIQSSILGAITAHAVQARLRTACFAPIASICVDHADVAATPVELIATNAAVRLHVPLDVFVVLREDVLTAPNAVPGSAMAPAGRVLLLLEMTINGTVVSLRCIDADLGQFGIALGAAAPSAKTAIVQAVGSPVTSDLSAVLGGLGMPAPSSSRVELLGSIVAIRFEPAGQAFARLFPSQEWGLFLDGDSTERLAMSRVPVDLGSRITSMTLDAHWRPAGTTPHVDVDYAGKAQVPDPFAGDVDGTLSCDFSLASPAFRGLRTTVHWSIHVNLGDFVPGFIDREVETVVEAAMDPATFGGIPIGDHAFTIDSPLPDISFGGVRFRYTSAVASPAGMTIGGPVLPVGDLLRDTVQPSVTQFGLPYRLSVCSQSGAPKKTASLGEVATSGGVWLEGCGVICDVEIMSPGDWIAPYVRWSAATSEIEITIPSAVAFGIVDPVRLFVRTARGVRLIDLGIPPRAQLDANGNVANALLDYIDNCLYITVGPLEEHGVNWGNDNVLGQAAFNPPLEYPNWTTYLGRQRGISVQLVTLFELEPGELIQFRSRDHNVDVTADRNGRALVPVLLPLANGQERARLIRVNRRSIVGHFSVRTAIFAHQAALPAGTQQRFAFSPEGTAVLTTEFEDHIDVHEIGRFGAPILVKSERIRTQEASGCRMQAEVDFLGASTRRKDLMQRESHDSHNSHTRPLYEEIALNPQPLPPCQVVTRAHNPLLAQRMSLPGITSLIAVPGFAEATISIATMADGSMLVLDLGENGATRVAGTFAGPIGSLDVSGDWAFAADPDRVAIYRVTRD